ncbi:Autophagy-related protein 11 [Ophiocordyceps sinensis CO18]|uniref:Autophagy-related protein 11 n=1 Tax=Ophiocordyceps sinensis (strain Co18 / CGMCC 3.14243) TaxID=911162 RepID=T5AIY0_OPHSC|nr:Autophagy-related protein 11 [Ophiocordyceps sinensis CO18]
MATQVLIAHTGQRLEVDAAQFSTLDDLKAWVAQNSSVSLQHMVALTPQGRNVKFASLHAEKEIYIYDVRVTQQTAASGSPPLVSDVPLPRRLSVPTAPNSIDDVQAISSWQHLYEERRSWALRLTDSCSRTNSAVVARYDEIDVILKCLDAAVANLEISVKQIEPKYMELKKWVDPALSEHQLLATEWEHYLALARNVSVSPSMVEFMTRGEVTRADVTLEDLVELETVKKAGKLAPTARRRFGDKAAQLDKLATQMYQGFEGLVSDFDKLMGRSIFGHSTESAQLLQDIEAVAGQIDADYQTSLGYGGSQRDLAQASKTASNHTERLVPSLNKRAKEMDEMIQYATRARNDLVHESVGYMRTITDITALHSSVKNQINILNQSEDDMTTFDYLRLIHQLPYMYASFVVEAIRRREWVDKVRTDSSTLANEMALFQDEEAKRRRKWQKMVGSMYGPSLDTNVVGLEVNLLGEDMPWPAMTKEELDGFLQTLQDKDTDPPILEDVGKLIQELSSPTKQQYKRLKAFKNGSVHEAALGRSGLRIRGDDELIRTLQEDKSKLESKLKTAESRVRRLEDLLHRQSQASRPGNLFPSQKPQSHERRDSVSSVRSHRPEDLRRASDGADSLFRRIEQLENELRDEKQRSAKFDKDLSSRTTQHDDMKGQIQEANSTKKDLLENMEAQKREFLDERKSLEDEIKTLKARLEDTEDDMEHFGESRENEKAAYDEKVQALEAENVQLRKQRTKEQAKAVALEREAAVTRAHLSELRGQLSDGETGSETLRKKLEAEERKSTEFAEELASCQSHIGSLEDELGTLRHNAESLDGELSAFTTRYESRNARAKDLTQRLYTQNDRLVRLLERIGYSVSRESGQMTINKVPRSERSAPNPNDSSDPGSGIRRSTSLGTRMGDSADLGLLYWMDGVDGEAEADKYDSFVRSLGSFDMDLFSDTLYLRIKEAEHKARKWQREARAYRDRAHVLQKDAHDKIAFRHFKDGDLALFLPTRNQQAGAWAAFNVGFPHYFLREQDAHRLRHREWLVARISRIQERVVDLSKSLQPANDAESMNDEENDNPFQLSDGLRWYLIDAHEDKPGAPSTPGMGKSTVAANTVEATADIQSHAAKGKGRSRDSVTSIEGINKTLSKSLDSRRSSSGSKKALPFPTGGGTAVLRSSALASETNSLRAAAPDTPAGTSPVQGGLLTASNANADQRARPEARRTTIPGTESQKQPGETRAQGSGGGKSSEVRGVDSLLGP